MRLPVMNGIEVPLLVFMSQSVREEFMLDFTSYCRAIHSVRSTE